MFEYFAQTIVGVIMLGLLVKVVRVFFFDKGD
jgi:hypothetical protein